MRIAAKVTGIGNGSCGPLTDEQYRTRAARTEYTFFIVPLATVHIRMKMKLNVCEAAFRIPDHHE
ncbi:MAG: hypothetical protein ACR2PG_04080 [Hyphomicrobiaceae bacterium]